jgi:hypothetical protein
MAAQRSQFTAGQRMRSRSAILNPADVQGAGFEANLFPTHFRRTIFAIISINRPSFALIVDSYSLEPPRHPRCQTMNIIKHLWCHRL